MNTKIYFIISSIRLKKITFAQKLTTIMSQDLYQAPDYFLMDELLTDEHKMIRDAAREWVKREVSPIIEEACQKAEFPKQIVKGLGEIGGFGPYIPTEYGGAGLDQISYGLIMQELERGDSGIRSTSSVQSSLVMYPIWKYGSEEQKMKFLPKLATGEFIGCFGLTEPDHGSNPGGMVTNIKDMGDHYILNGAKMWISNAPFADVAVVWAKNEEGRIKGVLVERGMEGFTTPETHGKWSLRASATGELVFDNVKIPKDNILPNKDGLGAPLGCLDSARYGIAWGTIGTAMDCYDTALRYAKERIQGKNLLDFMNPDAPGVAIINHPDVRRQLLSMKAYIEGMRSLLYYVAWCEDKADTTEDATEKEKLHNMLDNLIFKNRTKTFHAKQTAFFLLLLLPINRE